jgi:hypothetical protein
MGELMDTFGSGCVLVGCMSAFITTVNDPPKRPLSRPSHVPPTRLQGSFYTVRRAQDIACTIKLRGCCCCGQTDPIPGAFVVDPA